MSSSSMLWLWGAVKRAIGARVLADDGKLRSIRKRPLSAQAGRAEAAGSFAQIGGRGSKGSQAA